MNHDYRNHNCYNPLPTQAVRRGTFVVETSKDKKAALKMSAVEFFKELTANDDTLIAREQGLLPSTRTCLYGGNAAVTEETRLKLWSLGTSVRDSAASINEWVDQVPPWPKEDSDEEDTELGSDEEDMGASLQRQQSFGSAGLNSAGVVLQNAKPSWHCWWIMTRSRKSNCN